MIYLDEDLRTARLQLIVDAIDAAATPGKLLLYSGSRPAGGAAITDQVLQVTITLAQPCATVEAALITFVPDVEGMRVAGDEITWGRFVDGDDNFVMDATVTGTGGGGDILITNVNGFIGGFVRITAGAIGE